MAGVVTSWRSRDGSHGAVVMKLDRHRAGARSGVYFDKDSLRTIDWAVRRFRRELPRPLRAGAVEINGSFAGLQSAVRRTYSYRARRGRPAGRVLTGAGYDDDDAAWFGAVFGPGDYVVGEGFDVFLSLTRRDR